MSTRQQLRQSPAHSHVSLTIGDPPPPPPTQQLHGITRTAFSASQRGSGWRSSPSSSAALPQMGPRGGWTWQSLVPSFLYRIHKVRQMDFELAVWQMMWLVVAPRRVYKNIYYNKQTKNQWARDDPAFVVLLSAGLSVMALFYGLYYHAGFWGIVRTIFFMVLVDYALVGTVVATFCWWFANRFLQSRHMTQSAEQSVEWAYAFDVHTNAFFPVFLLTYVLQFVFLSILLQPGSIVGLVLGNTIYMSAIVYYCYITFLGYNGLPFLQNAVLFLYPVPVFFIVYLAAFFGLNFSQLMMHAYFGG